VIKNALFYGETTPPELLERINKLYGIIIEIDRNNYAKVIWSDDYGTFWSCEEGLEMISEV
jgi:hypothetical protein